MAEELLLASSCLARTARRHGTEALPGGADLALAASERLLGAEQFSKNTFLSKAVAKMFEIVTRAFWNHGSWFCHERLT